MTKMNRYALTSAHPFDKSFCTTHPDVIVPHAVPALPRRVYQAKMSLRIDACVSWARVDSSMARKGPISFPLCRHQQVSQTISGRGLQVIIPRTNDAKYACRHQNPIVSTKGEYDPTCTHQCCPQRQYPPSSQAICN